MQLSSEQLDHFKGLLGSLDPASVAAASSSRRHRGLSTDSARDGSIVSSISIESKFGHKRSRAPSGSGDAQPAVATAMVVGSMERGGGGGGGGGVGGRGSRASSYVEARKGDDEGGEGVNDGGSKKKKKKEEKEKKSDKKDR